MFAKVVQSFIKKNIDNSNLSGVELSKKIGVSTPLVSSLINARKPYPAFSSIIKIANAFNSSIDEVLGKNDIAPSNKLFIPISEDQAINNLKNYINLHVNNPTEAAENAGVGTNTIKSFLDDTHSKKTLSIGVIYKLSDHLNVSIDEMVGRVSPSKEKAVEQLKTTVITGITNISDLDKLKQIKASVAQKTQPIQKSEKEDLPASKINKSMSHVERLMQERTKKINNRER